MPYNIADMNPTQTILRLERQIDALRQKLLRLGPIHPGSVSRQYQVCAKPGCRCMDPKNPQRHGPYYKLAYVHRGKPVCRFVRADCATEVQRRLANYKVFREIIDAWIALAIQRGTLDWFSPRPGSPTPQRSRRIAPAKHPLEPSAS